MVSLDVSHIVSRMRCYPHDSLINALVIKMKALLWEPCQLPKDPPIHSLGTRAFTHEFWLKKHPIFWNTIILTQCFYFLPPRGFFTFCYYPIFVMDKHAFDFQEPTQMVSDPFSGTVGQTLWKQIHKELITFLMGLPATFLCVSWPERCLSCGFFFLHKKSTESHIMTLFLSFLCVPPTPCPMWPCLVLLLTDNMLGHGQNHVLMLILQF